MAACDPDWLAKELGSVGRRFYLLAHANDPRPVEGRSSSKSIGSECTLAKDVSDELEIKRYLRRSAEDIAKRLRRKRYVAFGVQVKLKTTTFKMLTRQHRRRQPTDGPC
ncbi:MAG: DNA polymerase IV, partial [Bacteroidetes bacterium]|nr:DNA polymerase IV [Bacteroidota bacterium]